VSGQVVELRPGAGRLVDAGSGAIMPDVRPADPVAARVRLRLLARLDVEQAREFLMMLDGRVAGADLPRMAYLLGALEGHAQSLMDVIDAVTEV
jgi:hypothetical protein